MNQRKEQACKNEERFVISIRDQIDAQYMATRLPWQTRAMKQMTDERYCKHMDVMQKCRLGIEDRKVRIRKRREEVAKRKEKRAKYAKDPLEERGRPKTAKGKV